MGPVSFICVQLNARRTQRINTPYQAHCETAGDHSTWGEMAKRRRLIVLLLCWLEPCAASTAHRCAPPARLRHGQPVAQDLRPANPSNFLKLAKKGDADALAACLESGIDLNAGRQGSFALHIASGLGHTKVVQLLLGAGVQPTTVEKGVTALHSAAFKCHAEVVDLLLAAGADPDAITEADGSTALCEAAASGHVAVVERLLAAGADSNKGRAAKPLPSAAIQGRDEVVRRLLDSGADPNGAEEDGSTALLKASAMGHTSILGMLLAAGADPNRGRGEDPITPLHYAAYGGFEEAVQVLLAAGARPDAKDADGSTPLRFALAQSAHARVAHALLRAGTPFEETEL